MLIVMPSGRFADTESGYLSRGHCLLELATSRLPRLDMFGKWYIPGCEESGQWGSVVTLDCDTGEARHIERSPLIGRSPLDGNYTVEADRDLIRVLVQKYVAHHDYVEQQVLAPLKACATFAEYLSLELPECLRLQTFQDSGTPGQSPSQWLDTVLPAKHIEKLKASLGGMAAPAPNTAS